MKKQAYSYITFLNKRAAGGEQVDDNDNMARNEKYIHIGKKNIGYNSFSYMNDNNYTYLS